MKKKNVTLFKTRGGVGWILSLVFLIAFSIQLKAQPQMAPKYDVPSSASGSFSNGVSLGTGSVEDPSNGIDGNLSSAADFVNFGFGFGPTWTYTVNLNGAYAGDVYLNVGTSGSVLSASILGGLSVTAYNNNSSVWSIESGLGNVFASWGVNFGSGSNGYIHPTNTRPFNKLVFTYSPLANVGIIGGSNLKIYEVRRVPYEPTPTILSSRTSPKTTLTASTTNLKSDDVVYTWYKGTSATGTPVGTGPTLTNTVEGAAYTVKATVYDGGSFSPSRRSGVATIGSVPSPAITLAPDTWYTFQNTQSEKFLGVTDGSNQNGSTLSIHSDPDNTANQWKLVNSGSGYQIINRKSGKAVDIRASVQDPGSDAIQYTAGNGVNQQWTIVPVGDGTFQIQSNLSDHLVLDNEANGTDDGNPVVINTNSRTPNQTWTIKEVVETALGVHMGETSVAESEMGVVVTWQTYSEVDLADFVIQRSVDGIIFSDVSRVRSKGNSAGTEVYNYTDVSAPEFGRVYYRVKAISKDGTIQTGEVTFLDRRSSTDVKVFPNPAVDYLNVVGVDQSSSYEIWDMSGKLMVPQTKIGNGRISVKQLRPGVYILRFGFKGQVQSLKFIKR